MSSDEKNPNAPRGGGCCGHSQSHGSGATAPKTASEPAGAAKHGDKKPATAETTKQPGHCH